MHTAEVRTRLLDAAVSLLAEKGVDDLSLHEVAASANTSTTAVCTLFGGKRELVAAVVKEGFRMFAASQLRLSQRQHRGACWRWGGRSGNGHCPSRCFTRSCSPDCKDHRTLDISHEAMEPLMAAVSALPENGPAATPRATPRGAVAMAVWGHVHGIVSLELSGVGLSAYVWADANEAALSSIARAYVGS